MDKAKTRYDIILIDTNHLLTSANLITLDYSDNIIYILTNDLIDIKNMRTMLSIYSDTEKENYTLLLNKATNKKGHFSKYEIKHMIDSDIDYVIEEDMYIKNIEDYALNGRIITLDKQAIKNMKKTYQSLEKMLKKLIES